MLVVIAGSVPQLPGLVAAMTDLPVIAVTQPDERASAWEVLAAIHNLPTGVPLAMAGIGESGARNAGLLAVALLAQTDARVAERYRALRWSGAGH